MGLACDTLPLGLRDERTDGELGERDGRDHRLVGSKLRLLDPREKEERGGVQTPLSRPVVHGSDLHVDPRVAVLAPSIRIHVGKMSPATHQLVRRQRLRRERAQVRDGSTRPGHRKAIPREHALEHLAAVVAEVANRDLVLRHARTDRA